LPKVSVIIPTYNRASLVIEAIDSVISQTYQDYEIIVIDDGSTDNTPDVLAAYSKKVKYVRLPHSGKPATARNAGLSIAEGEYVAFLDSDDRWLPTKLEQQIPILESDLEIGLVCSNSFVNYQGKDESDQLYLRPDPGFSGDILPKLLEQNFIITSTAVIRRALLEKTGPFCQLSELTALEDFDLWLRISSLSRISFTPEALAIYTEQPEQSLRFTRRFSQHWRGHLLILARLQKFLIDRNLQHEIRSSLLSEYALRYKKNLIRALLNERQPIQAISVSLNVLIVHPGQLIRWILRKASAFNPTNQVSKNKPHTASGGSYGSQQGKLRLHLGCGETYLPGFENIDFPPDQHTVQTTHRADIYADITKLSYPWRSVNQIRLHHVFEHFDRPTALYLLIEWSGWLEDGGLLVIETPDFELSAKSFLKGNAKIRHKTIRHLFGSQEATWAIHQDGWYKDKFELYLISLGFKELKFYCTEWEATRNITVEAQIRAPFMERSEQIRVAEELLRQSLIDETASEQRLLQIWIDKLRSLIQYQTQ
jgi:glycosyltransferase involved in cell wall biosynthesis/predicted SAM-dependent methyltransferase